MCRNKNIELLYIIKKQWDKKYYGPKSKEIFRYRIDNIPERLIDNFYIIQFNPDRGTKRRKPQKNRSILQPFNPKKFSFTAASRREYVTDIMRKRDPSKYKHYIFVNVSPISHYHSLLCPYLWKNLPQYARYESIVLAIDIMYLMGTPRDLKIAYNSMCGFASVNHLHYHLLFEKNVLPVETVDWRHIKGILYCLDDRYPIPALCFKVPKRYTKSLGKEIYKVILYCYKKSIAHNILITNQSKENEGFASVIIYLRKSTAGIKKDDKINVAALELSGWFSLHDRETYDNITRDGLEAELKKWKLDNFDQICQEIAELF